MDTQEKVFKRLNEMNIKYEVVKHKAAYTIDDMDDLDDDFNGAQIVKNLFLRNAKGNQHFLVVMDKDKQANLKQLRNQIESTALSFASEERLEKYLKLKKGSVSPLGIINDCNGHVEVLIDRDLKENKTLGVHPNDNRATVLILVEDLVNVIKANGNIIRYVTI